MDELTQRFFETLLRTQFLPAERMLTYRRTLLERLVRHARAQVPFYRDSGRLDVLFRANDSIDWERWDEVPILTRLDARRNSTALYAETIPPECGEVMSGTTSGSTGTPLAYRVNSLMSAASTAALERAFVWAGLPDQLTMLSFQYMKNAAPGTLTQAYETRIRGAPRRMHTFSLLATTDEQGRFLAALKPTVVMGYPGLLSILASELPRELDDHQFRMAICLGEVASPKARAAIERGFRCPTMDLYTGSEFGAVAIEDRSIGRMLVCEESMHVEFKDQDGYAGIDENLAEVIFTPLYNYAMPLIRYATGDYAVVDPKPSPDDRTLRRIERILGRDRNAFILPSGKAWWPRLGPVKGFGEWLDFDQIQFAQTRRDHIEVRFVSRDPRPVKDAERLIAMLRDAAPEPIGFALRQVRDIPRHPSGKFDDFVCEIDAAAK